MPAPVGYLDSIADPTPAAAPGPAPPFPDGRADSLTPKLASPPGSSWRYRDVAAEIAEDKQDGIDRWAVDLLQTQQGIGVFDLYLKATLARAAYFGDRSVIDQITEAIGADGYDAVADPDPLVPNVYCWWWRNVGAIIGVEGTSNYRQWINYVYSSDLVPAVAPDGTHFGKSLGAFQSTALACVPAVQRLLASHVKRGQVYQLIGHSLGGAVAHMLGRYVGAVSGFRPVLVTTFGAPRPGNTDYRDATPLPPTVRVVHETDPVTQVPPANFVRAPLFGLAVPCRYVHPRAQRVGLPDATEFWLADRGEGDEAGGVSALAGLSTIDGAITRHVLATYCRLLQNLMERFFPDDSDLWIPLALSTANETLARAGG